MEDVKIKANYLRYKSVSLLALCMLPLTLFRFQVEDLAENQPSVVVGDFVLVRAVGQSDKTWFELGGCIM